MIDLGPGRNAPANYVTICHSIADSYPVAIAHGLQKDAIQNSLDARKSKKATVRVHFRVIKNKRGKFLTFTDSNTTGLTGDVKSNIEDYKHLGKNDHWARFEAFAFTKDDPDALGARGQGKFIFLRASEQYLMFYDTLREDGVYRLGATQVTTVGRKNFPFDEKWEGAIAKSKLQEYCGLEPLSEVGTRIIVCKPIDEVLEDIRTGVFVSAIQETWFRAIERKSNWKCGLTHMGNVRLLIFRILTHCRKKIRVKTRHGYSKKIFQILLFPKTSKLRIFTLHIFRNLTFRNHNKALQFCKVA